MNNAIRIKQLHTGDLYDFGTGNIATYNYLSGLLDFEYVSGLISRYVTETGYLGPNFLAITGGSQDVLGIKTFYQSPLVVNASGTSGAVSFYQLTGSGSAYVTTTALNNSGLSSFMTLTGFNVSGFKTGQNVAYNFHSTTPTVQTTLSEQFVGSNWEFTGYYLGVGTTGTGGSPLTGTIYQKSITNTSETIKTFSLAIDSVYSVSGFAAVTITGANRIGISITAVPNLMTGLTIGLFGVSY